MELHVDNVHAERSGRQILAGLSFAAKSGELVVITGPNGSGKTTLLRLIAGYLDLQSGDIALKGGDPELSIAKQLHFEGHLDALKPVLTVEENMKFWATFLGSASIEATLSAFELANMRNFPVAILSAGQRRRLALSRLKLAYRPLWLLDEPFSNLDKASCHKLASYMQQHLAGGGLIVAATHSDLGLPANHTIALGRSS